MHHFQVLTRPKMSLTVILLLLSGLASLATANNGAICEALEQHHYKEMALLSLTWYNEGEWLYVFTEPGYRYYPVSHEKVTQSSMDLSQASPLDMSENADYTAAFLPIKDQTPKGTYLFSLYNYQPQRQYNWKILFLIVTEKGPRSGSFYQRNAFNEVTEPEGNPLPDFTLESVQYNKTKDLSGVVFSSDSSRFSGLIMLSQYTVHWEGSKVTGLPPPQGQTDDRPAFFLQVANSPDEVHLVPSSASQPDSDAQLLSSLPRSFLYEKKHLVLFDTATGCVHIIADFGDFTINETQSRTFKRQNLPFEAYFKCDKQIDDPDPNRCQIVRGSHTGNSVGKTLTGFLVVAVLAVGLLYAIVAMKKKGKGTKGKSAKSMSSSAISGRAKSTSGSTSKGFKASTSK